MSVCKIKTLPAESQSIHFFVVNVRNLCLFAFRRQGLYKFTKIEFCLVWLLRFTASHWHKGSWSGSENLPQNWSDSRSWCRPPPGSTGHLRWAPWTWPAGDEDIKWFRGKCFCSTEPYTDTHHMQRSTRNLEHTWDVVHDAVNGFLGAKQQRVVVIYVSEERENKERKLYA